MDGEEIRTVYISGFPPDVKEREINLLFRKSPGFEGAFVKYTGLWAHRATCTRFPGPSLLALYPPPLQGYAWRRGRILTVEVQQWQP